MNINLQNKHFLTLSDFTKDEILFLIESSKEFKKYSQGNINHQYLSNLNIALIFEKTSTRTRCAFEVAAKDLGANVTNLNSSNSQIGYKETIKDTARVLSRMFDGIVYRGYSQSIIEELAMYSKVPVFNALTDEFHPTQMLADILTISEFSNKPFQDISYAYIGDAHNNVGNSFLHIGALLGMDIRIIAPISLYPEQKWIDYCLDIGKKSGARILITEDINLGLNNLDFLYTDIWLSMGEDESKWESRISLLNPYRIDANLVAKSNNPNLKIMHCLPAYHNKDTEVGNYVYKHFGLDGVEITDEVFEKNSDIIFTQAENRMHTIKALLFNILKK